MKRMTISLPDELSAAAEREAKRRGVPVSQIAREGLEMRLGRKNEGKRHVGFAAIGDSGHGSIARDMEEMKAKEWDLGRSR